MAIGIVRAATATKIFYKQYFSPDGSSGMAINERSRRVSLLWEAKSRWTRTNPIYLIRWWTDDGPFPVAKVRLTWPRLDDDA